MSSLIIRETISNLSIDDLRRVIRKNRLAIQATERTAMIHEILGNETFMENIVKCVNAVNRNNPDVLFDAMKGYLKPGVSLFQHQEEAVKFMQQCESRVSHGMKGGILNLQMGLGKTLITLVYCVLTHRKGDFPTLVVVPKTLMQVWKDIINEFFTTNVSAKVLYLHREHLEPDNNVMTVADVNRTEIMKNIIVITTYDMVDIVCREGNYAILSDTTIFGEHKSKKTGETNPIIKTTLKQTVRVDNPVPTGFHVLYNTPWKRLILDESQKIANKGSVFYISILLLYSDYAWCITGTPIKNYSRDLLAQLWFIGYDNCEKEIDWKPEKYEHDKISENILTLTLANTVLTLPELNKVEVICEFSHEERYMYNQQLKILISKVFEYHHPHHGKRNLVMFVFAAFLALRQICICPYVITEKYSHKDELKEITQNSSNLKYNCAKMKKLKELCQEVIQRGEQVVVFSAFSEILKIAKNMLEQASMSSTIIIGSKIQRLRQKALDEFKEGKFDVLLLNYQIGAEGINLTEVNNCILLEPWWADYIHKQAYSRIWRQGQLRKCNVYFMYTKDTVEQRLLTICNNKNLITNMFFPRLLELKETTYIPVLKIKEIETLANLERVRVGLVVSPPVEIEIMNVLAENAIRSVLRDEEEARKKAELSETIVVPTPEMIRKEYLGKMISNRGNKEMVAQLITERDAKLVQT